MKPGETLEQLRSSDLLLRVIAENVCDLIAVVDSEGKRIWNNAAYAERLGYSPEEMRGTYSMVEIHPDDVSLVKQVFAESMSAGRGRRIEYRMRHRAGSWVTLESEGRIAQNWNGHEKILVIVARDITERKNRERAEHERTQRMLDQAEALTDFSQSRELQEGDLPRCFLKASQIAARILPCQRITIWLVNAERTELICRSLFENGATCACGDTLRAAKHPAFFSALKNQRLLVLPPAADSGHPNELATYFSSHEIHSAMILPLLRGSDLLGFLGFEQTSPASVAWSIEDKNFAVTLAENILLALEVRERLNAHQALQESQQKLAAELTEAAGYVRSILPRRMKENGIETDWRYIPSAALGGDSFGYHWLDENHFALYLLDVVGHGVRAALVSVSVMNILRSQALPETDFTNPGAVLAALNNTFQMPEQDQMYFTIWYGVYHRDERRISYASGGHPPAILFTGASRETARAVELSGQGLIIGAVPDAAYETRSCALDPFAEFFVFSDGIYEIRQRNRTMGRLSDFVGELANSVRANARVDAIVREAQLRQQSLIFADDCSLLKIAF